MNNRYVGSTIALLFGILSIFIAKGQGPIGIVTISGALAYKSCKKRRLGLAKRPKLSIIFEIIIIVFILYLCVLPNDRADLMYNHPLAYVIAPLWAIIAYAICLSMTTEKKRTSEPNNINL